MTSRRLPRRGGSHKNLSEKSTFRTYSLWAIMSPPSSASPWQSPRSLVESGQVTLPQVFEWNAKHNPHHPVFVYHDGQKVNTVDFMQCTQGIRRAARYLRAHVPVQGCVAVFAHAGVNQCQLVPPNVLPVPSDEVSLYRLYHI